MKKKILMILLLILISFLFNNKLKAGLNFNYDLRYPKVQNRTSQIQKKDRLFNRQLEVDYRFFREYNYDIGDINLIQPHFNYAKKIKGIYVSAWAARDTKRINRLIKEVEESDLNSLVIDLKDASGKITFDKELAKNSSPIIKNLKRLIDECHQKGIYVIGRLVVFKDPILAEESETSLKYLWKKDKKTIINSKKWTSPYSKKAWEYNSNIAIKAAKLGLDEIQLDYIRFPTLADNSNLIIKVEKDRSKADIIVQFLKYIRSDLKEYDILLSVDVFGLTTTVKGDLGIGQDITRMVDYVDYISPMIYPSHYSSGMYGVDDPESTPYHIIFKSLEDAQKKLGEKSYKLRPWLQDFSLSHSYKTDEIKAQIKAVKDRNLAGWLLWNPRSRYTIDAVKIKKKEG